MRSKAYDQLRVYLNPFSTATNNPKIPDGKCRLSVGVRLQAVREWENDDSNVMEFLIFPGLLGGLEARNATPPPTLPGLSGLLLNFSNHLNFNVGRDSETDDPAGDVRSFYTIGQDANTQCNKWRLVSQGVRFTMVNNSDENDGWWEAVRLVMPSGVENVEIRRADTGGALGSLVDGDVAGALVSPEIDNIIDPTVQLVEQPSYVTGRLRNIHQFLFQLKPHDTNHPFVELQRSHKYQNVAPTLNEAAAESQFIDHSYDCIFLRVHCRSNQNPGATRIMAHVTSNQELLYDNQAQFARFMTETDKLPSLPWYKHAFVESTNKAGRKKSRVH